MLRAGLATLAVAFLCWNSTSAVAQIHRRYFDEVETGRLGLESVWTTQVPVGSGTARASQIHLQVVGMNSYQQLQETSYEVFEVKYGDRIKRFSANDLGRSGRPLGRDEAERLAEKLVIQLKAQNLEPELSSRRIPSTMMYVQSGQGTLQAIDAENGNTLWALTVGLPNHPHLPPAANDRFVATISGSQLYLLDRTTGQPIWDRPLRQTPTLGASMSSKSIFIPGLNGQVEGYRLPDEEQDHHGTPAWIYQTGARITTVPATTGKTVSWASARGQMFVADLEGPQMMYRLQTAGPIFGQAAFLPPNRLVIASTDGYISAVNEMDGSLLWESSVGFDMYQTPLAQPDRIYAVTRLAQMYAMSTEDGSEVWVTPGISRVLACGKDRVYVLDEFGQLTALDKETGARIAHLPTRGYDASPANAITDRVYLASGDGVILVLA